VGVYSFSFEKGDKYVKAIAERHQSSEIIHALKLFNGAGIFAIIAPS
jgi:hypothetical protein